MPSQREDRHPIPLIYRLTFRYLEPCTALGGVTQALFAPVAMTEISMPVLASYLNTPATPAFAALQTLYTQMAGGWLIMVFNDFVTLRAFDRDIRVWQYILSAHILCDITYCWALTQDWGAKAWDPWSWNFNMWLSSFFLTIVPFFLKIAFLLGVGIDSKAAKRQNVGKKLE